MIQENYSKLLHTKEWKLKRIRIIERDNNICTCCHKTKKVMIVHHKYYYAYPDGQKFMPWEYPDSALITVCRACHKQLHLKYSNRIYYRIRK